MTRVQCVVTVDLPDGVTVPEWQNYVQDSVANWKGQFHPSEPLFHLDRGSVVVSVPKRMRDQRLGKVLEDA